MNINHHNEAGWRTPGQGAGAGAPALAAPALAAPALAAPTPIASTRAAPVLSIVPRRASKTPKTAAAAQADEAQGGAGAGLVARGGLDMLSFEALGVPANLVGALATQGVTAPFAIQAATLPDSLAGRDVLGRGRTGSGKTIAFAIPIVVATLATKATRQAKRPRGLIVVPTRELASQVAATIAPLADVSGLRVAVIFGGVSQASQVRALDAGVDIVVACPGRLEDLVGQGVCHLDAVQVTVLDEADHMADLGFLPAVKRILDRTPAGSQRLLFSATLDNGIDVLVKRYLSNPATHSVDPVESPVETMVHHILTVSVADKAAVIAELASGCGRTLLFMRTKHHAKHLARQLSAAGVPAVDLHGNLSQNARERNLAAFRSGHTRVLVATDIAARGIHVDDIGLVVHVDPPTEPKAYLHRSGRTARAGAAGVVATLVTPDQQKDMAALTRQAHISPTTTAVSPGHARLRELAGPAAVPVTLVALGTFVPATQSARQRASVAPSRPKGTAGRRSQRGKAHTPAVS